MEIIEKLLSLDGPYFHLLIESNKDITLVNYVTHNTMNTEVIIREIYGLRCDTLEKLFLEFARAFHFPDYFSYNWPSFDECINDLEWIEGDAYLLFIHNSKEVLTTLNADLTIFLQTLENTALEWRRGRSFDDFPTPPTPFHVVFYSDITEVEEIKQAFEEAGIININTIFF